MQTEAKCGIIRMKHMFELEWEEHITRPEWLAGKANLKRWYYEQEDIRDFTS